MSEPFVARGGWGPCEHGVGGRWVTATDGKTVRGARTQATVLPHLVSVFDHTSETILDSWRPRRRSTRLPPYEQFPAGYDLAADGGVVVSQPATSVPGLQERLEAIHRPALGSVPE